MKLEEKALRKLVSVPRTAYQVYPEAAGRIESRRVCHTRHDEDQSSSRSDVHDSVVNDSFGGIYGVRAFAQSCSVFRQVSHISSHSHTSQSALNSTISAPCITPNLHMSFVFVKLLLAMFTLAARVRMEEQKYEPRPRRKSHKLRIQMQYVLR
jgi:hypothetical protein